MRLILFLVSFFLLCSLFFPKHVLALAFPKQEFVKGHVVSVVKEGKKTIAGNTSYFQDLKIEIDEGALKGSTVDVENGGLLTITEDQKVKTGESIVLSKTTTPDGNTTYDLYDKFRLYQLIALLTLFIFIIVFIAGKKGVGSLLGLAISLLVILFFIVPQILSGKDPLVISIFGSVIILFLTSFLAHGFHKQTVIAVSSTLIALLFTALISYLFVVFAKLSGLGSEEAYSLQVGQTSVINLRGLFLGGIIIGTLGALNDITTTQAAAVFELHRTDSKLSMEKLYDKGFAIGREHVVSLVNTLILAYAGSAFAIFLFFILNPNKEPYWVIINSEIVSDEIVRTIGGSIGLILSVPIITILAAWYVKSYEK